MASVRRATAAIPSERVPCLTILHSTVGDSRLMLSLLNRIQWYGARCDVVGPIGGSISLAKGPHRP